MKIDSYSLKKHKNNRKKQNFEYYDDGADQHHIKSKIQQTRSKKANTAIDRIIRTRDLTLLKDIDDYT